MKKLSATKAIELSIEQWTRMLEKGEDKWDAYVDLDGKLGHGICFLCNSAQDKDGIADCSICPCRIVIGQVCMLLELNQYNTPDEIETGLSALLAVQYYYRRRNKPT